MTTKIDDIQAANRLAERIWRDIQTSQIRKVLAGVNKLRNRIELLESDQIPEDLYGEIQYLQVKLAYQFGRNKTQRNHEAWVLFHDDLVRRLKEVKPSAKSFMSFASFVEALVAYHKYHGGN